VNNAGIQHVSPVEEFPEDKWDAIIAINLSSAFHATKAALPTMKKNGWGRVINIASVHGLVASAGKVRFAALLSLPEYPNSDNIFLYLVGICCLQVWHRWIHQGRTP
jgi:NAD(P)-dependent dehydrogenase (short-subunit alcohol dehydrogenase family)